MLLHYLGELKIQTFCIYSVDTKENVKICIKCSDYNSRMRDDCMLSAFMCFLYQNLVLVAEYHVNLKTLL